MNRETMAELVLRAEAAEMAARDALCPDCGRRLGDHTLVRICPTAAQDTDPEPPIAADLDALQDSVHRETGRARAVKAMCPTCGGTERLCLHCGGAYPEAGMCGCAAPEPCPDCRPSGRDTGRGQAVASVVRQAAAVILDAARRPEPDGLCATCAHRDAGCPIGAPGLDGECVEYRPKPKSGGGES